MKAMRLGSILNLDKDTEPLKLEEVPIPLPEKEEVLIRVEACGVCRTELDEIEGRTPPSFFPIILGHQVVGKVVGLGPESKKFRIGERIGVAWIYSSCGKCKFCLSGQENLCPDFKATGRDANGGYAEFAKVNENFAYRMPEGLKPEETAPLLCAGAVGYRSLKLTELKDGENLGFVGFGASAHLVFKVVQYLYPHSKAFVFSRSERERTFARELGAFWAGEIGENSPEKLRAIIDTTPAWFPVVEALNNLEPGGRLVINAIRKEEKDKKALLNLSYERHLWMEKEVKSVANVTRKDVEEFLDLAFKARIRPEVQVYSLEEANKALMELKRGIIRGAKVLKM